MPKRPDPSYPQNLFELWTGRDFQELIEYDSDSSTPAGELPSSEAASSEVASSSGPPPSDHSDERASSDHLLAEAISSDKAASDAHLSDAIHSDMHLSDMHLSDAHLSDAHLSDAHLSDAQLSDRIHSDMHLSDAHLSDRIHSDMHLSDEALSSDQASDIHLAAEASSSDYLANLRPFFVNAGAISSNPVSSTTNTPALPSARVNGNLLISFQSNANAHAITVSAGWTMFDLEPTGASNEGALAYCYVDGNEAAPVFNWAGGGGNATANAGVVTQWSHVAVEKPIGALTQTNAFGQLGAQTLSLINKRGLSRIIAFSTSPSIVQFTTAATWESDVVGPLGNVGMNVDSKGADTATYTQAGIGSSTEAHLVLFELYGPFSPSASSDRDLSDAHLSDAHLSDRIHSDMHLSDMHLSDAHLSDAHLSDAHLSDAHLSDRIHSDMHLSDMFLSDRNLSDRIHSDILAHDAASSDDNAFTQPFFVANGTILTSASASSAAPALPTHNPNDILIACIEVANVKTVAVSAGWTILRAEPPGAGAQRLVVAYRFADGSEAAPTFSWTGGTSFTAFVMAYRAASLTNPWGAINTITATNNQGLVLTTNHNRSTVLAISGSPSVVNYTTANATNFTQRVHSAGASRPGMEVDDVSPNPGTNNGTYNQAGVGSSTTSSLILVELQSH